MVSVEHFHFDDRLGIFSPTEEFVDSTGCRVPSQHYDNHHDSKFTSQPQNITAAESSTLRFSYDRPRRELSLVSRR